MPSLLTSGNLNHRNLLYILNFIFIRNLGKVRKRELYKACALLGVPEENITVLRYTRLRDDPRVRWREELVSDILQVCNSAMSLFTWRNMVITCG